jgi:hypothetical protein
MNWKLVVVGGIVFFAVTWVVGFATGPLLHDGILKPLYEETGSFWRPELMQEPPDMGALMPRWIGVGLVCALIFAAVYGWVRSAFAGPGWKKGLKFGLVVAILHLTWAAGWSGVFNLPDAIWAWWALEAFAYNAIGGMALGWVAGKLAPEAGAPA